MTRLEIAPIRVTPRTGRRYLFVTWEEESQGKTSVSPGWRRRLSSGFLPLMIDLRSIS